MSSDWSALSNSNDSIDSPTGDYHLSDQSPCIGTGLASIELGSKIYTVPAFDLEGNGRPNPVDTNPDIGAYEHIFSTPVGNTFVLSYQENAPTNFTLFQNYPNPFNPVTMISYQLAASSEIDVSVYNQLGQKVTNLVSEQQQAGFYSVQFEGCSLTSGVYFYKIDIHSDDGKSFSDIKKMILMK